MNLLNTNDIFRFAQDASDAGRVNLTSAVAQLFNGPELEEKEKRAATELVLDLIRKSRSDLRAALSERLALDERVPAEIIIFLANDAIDIAAPVLRESPVLKDIDLAYIIAAKGSDHWRAIATRAKLGPVVIERLINTDDTATLRKLAENKNVTLPKNGLKRMIRTSLKDDALQAPLAARAEIDADLAADLYMCAGATIKRELSQRFRLSADMIEDAVDTLVAELSLDARGKSAITPAMKALARRFYERSDIMPDLLIRTLRRGQTSFFLALLAEKAELPAENVAERMKGDEGIAFATLARALGFMKSEFASMYLLTSTLRQNTRQIDEDMLARALYHFDHLRTFDAQRAVAGWK